MKTFTKNDIGCYADSGFGHDHVRSMLSMLVLDAGREDLAELLLGDMSDDASEEDEALDVLNELCSENVYFDFHDGDLMLFVREDE